MQLTLSTGHNFRPGTRLCIGGKRSYVVTHVESHTVVQVRRTLWTFVSDLIGHSSLTFDYIRARAVQWYNSH
jgi:hypothetical protein